MKIDIYKAADNQWRWRLKAKNGKIVADSGEGYLTRWGCKRAVRKFLGI